MAGNYGDLSQLMGDSEYVMAFNKEGFKVIRFTGSQIYKDPFACALEVVEMILSDAKDYITVIL